MAAKNPKRVAAGKKAWANRSTASKSRSYRKKSGSRRKPIQRGIGGRIGAVVLGAVPTGLSGIEAASTAMSARKKWKLGGMDAVMLGAYRFINNLSKGFLNVEVFGSSTFHREDGTDVTINPGAGIPGGAWITTSGVGLFMMFEDWLASKLAGGRPVKIPMTNYNAIGGS